MVDCVGLCMVDCVGLCMVDCVGLCMVDCVGLGMVDCVYDTNGPPPLKLLTSGSSLYFCRTTLLTSQKECTLYNQIKLISLWAQAIDHHS